MRLHEFIHGETADLHSWIGILANKIKSMVDSGKIPNNPDTIKNAAKQAAMDCRDESEQLDADMIADEVERLIFSDKFTKKAHLSGDYN